MTGARAELERLLDDVAAALGSSGRPVERAVAGGSVTWSRGGVVFAALGENGAELRLDPGIAAAAARTPDAAPSPRGSEWVRFNPRSIDPHAVDRLEAWFSLASQRAAGPAPGPPRAP